MDPVSLILQALVTGATKVAGDSVQDAYRTHLTSLTMCH